MTTAGDSGVTKLPPASRRAFLRLALALGGLLAAQGCGQSLPFELALDEIAPTLAPRPTLPPTSTPHPTPVPTPVPRLPPRAEIVRGALGPALQSWPVDWPPDVRRRLDRLAAGENALFDGEADVLLAFVREVRALDFARLRHANALAGAAPRTRIDLAADGRLSVALPYLAAPGAEQSGIYLLRDATGRPITHLAPPVLVGGLPGAGYRIAPDMRGVEVTGAGAGPPLAVERLVPVDPGLRARLRRFLGSDPPGYDRALNLARAVRFPPVEQTGVGLSGFGVESLDELRRLKAVLEFFVGTPLWDAFAPLMAAQLTLTPGLGDPLVFMVTTSTYPLTILARGPLATEDASVMACALVVHETYHNVRHGRGLGQTCEAPGALTQEVGTLRGIPDGFARMSPAAAAALLVEQASKPDPDLGAYHFEWYAMRWALDHLEQGSAERLALIEDFITGHVPFMTCLNTGG